MEAINTPTYLRLREQIRADIVAGVWRLGSHVTLAQLSTHYKVSNNPVREALLQLQGEGVIDMRMHRGAVIPTVDAKYVHDVYRLRGAVQAMLARDAARLATSGQVKELKELIDRHEALARAPDVPGVVAANRSLHAFIDALAGNKLAVEVLESRASLVDAFRRSRGYGVGRLDEVIAQHRKIMRAIARHDEDKAAAAAFEHTESSRQDLLRLIEAEG